MQPTSPQPWRRAADSSEQTGVFAAASQYLVMADNCWLTVPLFVFPPLLLGYVLKLH